MANLVSPGIQSREINLTAGIPALSTSIGGIVGSFTWGPADFVTLVGTEDILANRFGIPDAAKPSGKTFLAGANFLQYGNALQVVRAVGPDALNASSDSNPAQILNDDIATPSNPDRFYAKYPGALGNSLLVSTCSADQIEKEEVPVVITSNATFTPSASVTDFVVGDIMEADNTQYLIVSIDTVADEGEIQYLAGPTEFTATTVSVTRVPRSQFDERLFTTITVQANKVASLPNANLLLTVGDRVEISTGASTERFTVREVRDSEFVVIENLIAPVTGVLSRSWAYADGFDAAPMSYQISSAGVNSGRDGIHVVIVDAGGAFTGTMNTVLETYVNYSVIRNAQDSSGGVIYYVDTINNRSSYVRITEAAHNDAQDGTEIQETLSWGTTLTLVANEAEKIVARFNVQQFQLTGGVNDDSLSALLGGYERFADRDLVDVQLLIAGDLGYTAEDDAVGLANKVISIAEQRKDCVAFITPPEVLTTSNPNVLTDILAFRNKLSSSTYTVLDTGHKKQLDKYNSGALVTVPLCGDIAGLCARTDFERDPWFSPAGFNRGQIQNVVRLQFNPNQIQRDELYKKNINPVVTFPGQGTVLYGDKTLASVPSAFDRINVRRLLNYIKRRVAAASKSVLFEFNDEFTRNQFVAVIEPFLRDIQGRQGITDFRVIADDSVNTPFVVDSNEFRANIFVKPNRSINFISLNFIAVRSGVDFSEVVSNF